MAETKKPSRRGFAAMSKEDQRRIASQGGKEAHRRGTAHEWSSQEAAEAGRKGGKASHGSRKAQFQENPQERSDVSQASPDENLTETKDKKEEASSRDRKEEQQDFSAFAAR